MECNEIGEVLKIVKFVVTINCNNYICAIN